MSNRRRPIDEFTLETKCLARYMFRMIDKRDWGYWDGRAKRPKFAHSAEHLLAGPCVSQPLTRRLIESHREGRDRIYYTSKRSSGFCLAMIDVDEHQGQTDGLKLVELFVDAYFPKAYFERSGRGYHLYVPFRCKLVAREKFNRLLAWLRDSLRALAR